jgi:hypothetical protein
LLDTFTNLGQKDIQLLQKAYDQDWYKKLFISHHILFTFETIRNNPSKKKDIIAKFGQPWYDKHIASTTFLDQTFFNYQAIVKEEREQKKKQQKMEKAMKEDSEAELGIITPQTGGDDDDIEIEEEEEDIDLETSEGSEDEVIIVEEVDKNASKTSTLINEIIEKNENTDVQNEMNTMTPFDESKNDKPYDETLKNVYSKQYIYNQYIYMDDTIKKIKEKICASILFSDVFNKKHKYLIPSRIYLWSTYEFIDSKRQTKTQKLMLGQKWIVRNEILPIDIEPNENIKVYENIKGSLRSIRDNMRKYSSRIKYENDENNILEDYQDFINNREIYMIDIYHELGIGYQTDIELVRNLYDVYIKIYFPAISNEDFTHILDYLNNKPDNELNKIVSNYQTIQVDLLLENEVFQTVERLKHNDKCDAHSLCGYNKYFNKSFVTQTSINLNLQYTNFGVGTKIDLYRIFDSFIVNEKYPFIQYQTMDGKLVFKFYRLSDETDKKTVMSKWFENAPFGISFKVRVDSYKKQADSGDKYIAINLTENGRIDYKTQWKEDDEIDFGFIRNTFKDVMSLLNKLNDENIKIKFSQPKEHHFKYAFINTIQQFTLPEKYVINHNDLSDFARFFFPYISVVVDPRKRSSAQKVTDTSKYGTYLRYKRVSKFDNDARIDHRIIHFLRNYEYVPKLLADELARQFNITEKEAIERIEEVRARYPVLKKTRKILKKFENIPKYKPPGIGIDIQGKSRDNYKIRITGARSREQLDRINEFIQILIYLYSETYLYKNRKYLKIKDMLKQLTNIAKRRNKVEEIVDEDKEIKSIKQITKLDKSRVGFKPEKGQNHWTRSCQNSGNKKRQPIPYQNLEDLTRLGYTLDKTTGQYEKKVRVGKQEMVIKAAALDDNQGGQLYWTCDTTNNNKFVHIGFLSRSQNPTGICMPCCFKKDPGLSKNTEKRDYHLKCIGSKQASDTSVSRKNIGDRLYILQDTNKMLPERMGFLPKYLDMYFNVFLNNTISLKNHYLVNTNGYFLKYGSIQEEYPYLNAVANVFDTNVNEIKKKIIYTLKNDASMTIFTYLNNGDVKTQFENIQDYIRFIESNTVLEGGLIDDLLCLPGVLYTGGINIYVFEKQEDDFIVTCRNPENIVYFRDPNRANVFIIKENNNYFPIYLVKKKETSKKNASPSARRTLALRARRMRLARTPSTNEDVQIERYFTYSNLLEHIWNYFHSNCTGINLKDIKLPIAKVLALDVAVKVQIVDTRNKCRYLVTSDVMLPVKPSGCLPNVPIETDYRKHVRSLSDTVAAIANYNKKDYRPKGFIFKSKQGTDIITALSFANSIYLPIIEIDRDDDMLNRLMGSIGVSNYELLELSLYDKIDEEIVRENPEVVYDERSVRVATNRYITEGYELFRLEFSNYLANNQKVKDKLLKLIQAKDANAIKQHIYSIIDKNLETEFTGALQQGGFSHIENNLPDVKGYRPVNHRELCQTLDADKCNTNIHCALHGNKCLFRVSTEHLINYVNKITNDFLYNEVKMKEVFNLEDYYVSDIISYDVYNQRSNQKIIKSDNMNISKIMSELFGKKNIPIIGKKKVQRIEKSMVEENQRNKIQRAGDKYYQTVINFNPLFRAYANGFYWLKNNGANVIYRNIGYYSKLQTDLSNYFRSLVFDWILDTKNQNKLQINLEEFKHQLATSKDISMLGQYELYILNKIHGIPVVIYDQYDTPVILIDGEVFYDNIVLPKEAIHIQYHLSDVFSVKKIKSLVPNKIVSVYEV